MNDQELTSGVQDFFADTSGSTGKTGGVVGGIGAWILHLVVFAFAIYSGYHGISATSRYHANSGLGMAAGIIGILVIEAVLIGLYLAFFNRRITGGSQKIAAAATAGLGFVLSCMGIVGDSQMQAGIPVSGWLSAYLTWGLPIAPALMALGAAIVMATEPKHLRLMAQAVKEEDFQEVKHAKSLSAKTANLFVAQQLANMQLNAKMDAARYMLAAHKTPEVQQAIQQSAYANLPELMRSIGVDLPYGTVIEGQAIEPTAAPPRNTTEDVTPRPSRWNPFARRPAPAQPAPQDAQGPSGAHGFRTVVDHGTEYVVAVGNPATRPFGTLRDDAFAYRGQRGFEGMSVHEISRRLDDVDAHKVMRNNTHAAAQDEPTIIPLLEPQPGQRQDNGPAAKPLGWDARNPTSRQ